MALRICCIFSLAIIASPALAHKEAVIQWQLDGSLSRLPPEFQPALLLIAFGPGDGRLKKVESFSLRIADHTVSLPQCVLSTIRVVDRSAVRILASWYHDLTRGPPYISVELYESDPRSTSPKRSQVLHFNLATARLVEVGAVRYAAHESEITAKKVDFRTACAGVELTSFSERLEDHRPDTSLERTRER